MLLDLYCFIDPIDRRRADQCGKVNTIFPPAAGPTVNLPVCFGGNYFNPQGVNYFLKYFSQILSVSFQLIFLKKASI